MSLFMRYFLLSAMGILAVLMFLCLLRAILGPRFTDRLVAANMVSTLTVVFILLLAYYQNEAFLLDVSLLYAMLGFLAVVVISRVAVYRHYGRQLHKEEADHESC